LVWFSINFGTISVNPDLDIFFLIDLMGAINLQLRLIDMQLILIAA